LECFTGGVGLIVIVVDGLRVDFAEDYFDLPIDMHVKDSWFPTLTGCVHLSLLTGKTPAENNIPSMRWMDKHTNKKRTYFNLTGTIERDYRGETILNGIGPSVSIFSPVSSGFSTNIPPLGHIVSHGINTWELFDRLAFKILNRYSNFPFKFVCLYSVDELSHRFGLHSNRVKKSCFLLNEKINELINKTDDEVVVLSDHGLTETHTHIDLIKTLKKEGYKTRGFPLYFGSQEVFVAVCGNSMAHVYLDKGLDSRKLVKLFEGVKGIDEIYTENTAENDNIFTSPRSGDIVLTAEPSYDLRTWEFPKHKASHGSRCPEHFRVPIFSNKKIDENKIKIPIH
jgi:predicted AlkP superfamily pyrophosphatase or phosphodiesterase